MPPVASIAKGVSGFLGWWISELRDLLPSRDAQATSNVAFRRLILSLEREGVRVFREDGQGLTPIAVDGYAADAVVPLERALATAADVVPRLPIGIRVAQEQCFVRSTELPASARRDFARILELDLERSTPLRPADVYAAHVVDGAAKTKGLLDVRQFLLKRRSIEPVVAALEGRGIKAAFADCWSADRRTGVPVNFLASSDRSADQGVPLRVLPMLGGLALVLALSATLLMRTKQAEALAALDATTSRLAEQARSAGAVRERSLAANKASEQLAKLLAERRPAVLLIEELSRLLPDHTFLHTLRIDGDSVEISGLTPSAAALLPLLEGSELFHDARLTAPVQLESEKDRERFRLAVRIKRPSQVETPHGRGRP